MAIIEASIPLFFLLIIVELLIVRRRRTTVYRLNDSISDLSCGILSQLLGVFTKLLVLGAYAWFAAHLSLQSFGLAQRGPARRPKLQDISLLAIARCGF